MTGGTESTEEIKQPEVNKEVAQELKEVNDAAQRPAEKIETEMEVKPAEDLQKAFVEAVPLAQAAEESPDSSSTEGTVAPPETPTATQEDLDQGKSTENKSEVVQQAAAEVSTEMPVITLESAPEAGNVIIDRAEVAQAAGDQGDVMIDTVPLPETPVSTAEVGRRDDDGRDSIGTWPTPEGPEMIIDSNDGTSTVGIIDSNDREVIIDSNDGSSTVNTGPDMSGVAIIDSNDGSSTVGIIDSNDREVIIDSNDGTSRVNTGPDMSDVAIIDSNDGSSTVGIIDSNDGAGIVDAAERLDPASIIDSNDGASREAIGTWPTPEVFAKTGNAEGDNPPPPSDGMDPVSPSNPTQGVATLGSASGGDDFDFSPEMDGAEPGELREFEEDLAPEEGEEASRNPVNTVKIDTVPLPESPEEVYTENNGNQPIPETPGEMSDSDSMNVEDLVKLEETIAKYHVEISNLKLKNESISEQNIALTSEIQYWEEEVLRYENLLASYDELRLLLVREIVSMRNQLEDWPEGETRTIIWNDYHHNENTGAITLEKKSLDISQSFAQSILISLINRETGILMQKSDIVQKIGLVGNQAENCETQLKINQKTIDQNNSKIKELELQVQKLQEKYDEIAKSKQ